MPPLAPSWVAIGLGIYSGVLGAATVIALLSGQLDRYVHIFAMVLVGQTTWFIIAGGLLWRESA
jgi:hypothetical protein